MEKLYAQALWKSIENGRAPKDAVASLGQLLTKQGRAGLFPRIQKAFLRLAESKKNMRPRIFVANEKDSTHAFKASGIDEADVCIDTSLIGGWRLEGSDEIVDRSFKKYLLDIYNGAISG